MGWLSSAYFTYLHAHISYRQCINTYVPMWMPSPKKQLILSSHYLSKIKDTSKNRMRNGKWMVHDTTRSFHFLFYTTLFYTLISVLMMMTTGKWLFIVWKWKSSNLDETEIPPPVNKQRKQIKRWWRHQKVRRKAIPTDTIQPTGTPGQTNNNNLYLINFSSWKLSCKLDGNEK